MRRLAPIILFLFAGCGYWFLDYGDAVSTTNPSAEQIAYCRKVMYINPTLDIEPLGFHLQPGMDDMIRLKFVAKTSDPAQLFDPAQVDATKFSTSFNLWALDPHALDNWWDVSSQKLSGGNFSVPPPKAQGGRGLNVGYFHNGDGTMTVYVLWHET